MRLSFTGVRAAAESIAAYLPPTPAWTYPLLDATTGVSTVVKHENVQPTGAFKVRGGLTLMEELDRDVAALGVITASTGNHAQSVAYAAREHGVRATIVAPTTAPARKLAAVEALGASVLVHGADMGEANEHAMALAAERGLHYVSAGNDPAIVHGHATVYLELLSAYPDLEAIFVPIGSGSGAAGACVVRDRIAPHCRIIGVQSAAAPAAYESWRSRRIETRPCATRISGVATTEGNELPQSVLRGGLYDFLLVGDDDIDAARRILARDAHTLAEGAGAVSLAGLLAYDDRPRRCAVVVTGGNADDRELADLG